MIHRKAAARTEILSGWKDIAKFLGRGVRTVQRYEREMGLPIHRPVAHPLGGVFATKAELDDWVAAGPTQQDLRTKRLHDRTNKVGADFLQVDSEIALTLSGIGLQTSDREKRKRRTQVARKAYESIMRLRGKINFEEAGGNDWMPTFGG